MSLLALHFFSHSQYSNEVCPLTKILIECNMIVKRMKIDRGNFFSFIKITAITARQKDLTRIKKEQETNINV